MEYLGLVSASLLTTLFIVVVVAALGYLIGGIKIKGIALGTAGVLLVAILVGVLFSKVDGFTLGKRQIVLWNKDVKSTFGFVSNLGTAMFVTAVGLIAGPKFFRSFNKSMLAYLSMGTIVVLSGVGLTILVTAIAKDLNIAMATGLLAGALTSTPGLSAAKEAAATFGETFENQVTAGYGIGYLYGVLGVVLFVQIVPKMLKVNVEEERKTFVAANQVTVEDNGAKRWKIDDFGFFPFVLTIAFGMLLGSVKIPISSTSYFSFGSSGGTLIAGLIVGHFGRVGKISLTVPKETLKFFRELGLMLFLIGAGVPGGVNFVQYVRLSYFLYGILFTTTPMIVGFVLAKYVFKLSIFNNLGSITGGMTSTPALGSLISVAGTDDVASAYAATYPVALVLIVISSNLMILLGLA